MPNEIANPAMIAIVREARGWTQTRLADESSLNQGLISKAEAGLVEISGERLLALARALDAPPSLLTNTDPHQGLEVSCMFHRRRSSKVTANAGRRVEAIGHLTRISVAGLTRDVAVPRPELERFDVDVYESPERIADLFRLRWRVPSGPIGNIMALLDQLGIVIVVRAVGSIGQDAFSTWPTGGTPLMVVSTGLPTDRFRFTVAHELGHILMHVLPNERQEQQANEFAGALLMPEADIIGDLAGLTTRDFTRLMDLKAKWRVSVGALVQRALTLKVISDRQFKEFRIRMAQMGWNTSEPVSLPPEEPRLLASVIETRRRAFGEDDKALAAAASMTTTAFRRHYLGAPDAPASGPEGMAG